MVYEFDGKGGEIIHKILGVQNFELHDLNNEIFHNDKPMFLINLSELWAQLTSVNQTMYS